MRERPFSSREKGFLARRAGVAALAVVLASAATARGTTGFQASYLYYTSGAATGGAGVPIIGNQFDPGATVTVGGQTVPVGFQNPTRLVMTSPAFPGGEGKLYDVVVTNPAGPPSTIPGGWFADFIDVPQGHPFHAAVESIARDHITSGCLTGNSYCPDAPVNRDQMAVFLLRAEHGGGYIPPTATGHVFYDVPAAPDPNPNFAAAWIEQLYAEGITGGCAPATPATNNLPRYCPDSPVLRGQMAVFLLKIYEGPGHIPPPATGVFADVPLSDASLAPLAPWIEELARLKVTVGCGNNGFCPNLPNTRGQMAVFMTKTFHRPQAIRFLEQATWGPNDAEIGNYLASGNLPWLAGQFSLTGSLYPVQQLWPDNKPTTPVDCTSGTCSRDNYTLYPIQTKFFFNGMYGSDQLRQRMSWALHKLVVVSGQSITMPSRMIPYLNILGANAFGNYRNILYGETLNPAMGQFLNMSTNTKNNPNENYAREIMQLFSIGTVLLNMDGTTQNDALGEPLPSYDQSVIDNLKLVLTGWKIVNIPCPAPNGAVNCPDYISPMTYDSSKHDTTGKVLFQGFLPAPDVTHITGDSTGYPELNEAIDALYNHPNIAPYLARELIHSLVTSNPTPAYVERVAWAFNDDGNGARGSLWAVVKAILLDPEARTAPSDPTYGKLKEPEQFVLAFLRPFSPASTNRQLLSDGNINGQPSNMGQSTFRPNTVFSYFPQDYFAPPASAELFGPEFGIMDAATSLKRANFVNTMTFSGGIQPSGTDTPNGTSIDFTELQQLAPNIPNLVDRLNRLLMHGTMSDQMRSSIITAVTAVTPSTDTLKRARQALYLVATSSQYQVQR